MSVAMLRGVFLKFKAKTAVGQSGIAPRALWHLSDAGLIVLSKLFQLCEMLGFWPDNRIFTTLVRLPKEGGGS
eukprot:7836385-Pyramimonas_sp.AAC.1